MVCYNKVNHTMIERKLYTFVPTRTHPEHARQTWIYYKNLFKKSLRRNPVDSSLARTVAGFLQGLGLPPALDAQLGAGAGNAFLADLVELLTTKWDDVCSQVGSNGSCQKDMEELVGQLKTMLDEMGPRCEEDHAAIPMAFNTPYFDSKAKKPVFVCVDEACEGRLSYSHGLELSDLKKGPPPLPSPVSELVSLWSYDASGGKGVFSFPKTEDLKENQVAVSNIIHPESLDDDSEQVSWSEELISSAPEPEEDLAALSSQLIGEDVEDEATEDWSEALLSTKPASKTSEEKQDEAVKIAKAVTPLDSNGNGDNGTELDDLDELGKEIKGASVAKIPLSRLTESQVKAEVERIGCTFEQYRGPNVPPYPDLSGELEAYGRNQFEYKCLALDLGKVDIELGHVRKDKNGKVLEWEVMEEVPPGSGNWKKVKRPIHDPKGTHPASRFEWQGQALERWVNGDNGWLKFKEVSVGSSRQRPAKYNGIVEACTGAGKTNFAIKAIDKLLKDKADEDITITIICPPISEVQAQWYCALQSKNLELLGIKPFGADDIALYGGDYSVDSSTPRKKINIYVINTAVIKPGKKKDEAEEEEEEEDIEDENSSEENEDSDDSSETDEGEIQKKAKKIFGATRLQDHLKDLSRCRQCGESITKVCPICHGSKRYPRTYYDKEIKQHVTVEDNCFHCYGSGDILDDKCKSCGTKRTKHFLIVDEVHRSSPKAKRFSLVFDSHIDYSLLLTGTMIRGIFFDVVCLDDSCALVTQGPDGKPVKKLKQERVVPGQPLEGFKIRKVKGQEDWTVKCKIPGLKGDKAKVNEHHQVVKMPISTFFDFFQRRAGPLVSFYTYPEAILKRNIAPFRLWFVNVPRLAAEHAGDLGKSSAKGSQAEILSQLAQFQRDVSVNKVHELSRLIQFALGKDQNKKLLTFNDRSAILKVVHRYLVEMMNKKTGVSVHEHLGVHYVNQAPYYGENPVTHFFSVTKDFESFVRRAGSGLDAKREKDGFKPIAEVPDKKANRIAVGGSPYAQLIAPTIYAKLAEPAGEGSQTVKVYLDDYRNSLCSLVNLPHEFISIKGGSFLAKNLKLNKSGVYEGQIEVNPAHGKRAILITRIPLIKDSAGQWRLRTIDGPIVKDSKSNLHHRIVTNQREPVLSEKFQKVVRNYYEIWSYIVDAAPVKYETRQGAPWTYQGKKADLFESFELAPALAVDGKTWEFDPTYDVAYTCRIINDLPEPLNYNPKFRQVRRHSIRFNEKLSKAQKKYLKEQHPELADFTIQLSERDNPLSYVNWVVLHLKDGSVVEGELIEENPKSIRLMVGPPSIATKRVEITFFKDAKDAKEAPPPANVPYIKKQNIWKSETTSDGRRVFTMYLSQPLTGGYQKDHPVQVEQTPAALDLRISYMESFRIPPDKGSAVQVMLSGKSLIEGIDVPDVDVGIALSPASTSNAIPNLQSLGRVLRVKLDPHTKEFLWKDYIVLYDREYQQNIVQLFLASLQKPVGYPLTFDTADDDGNGQYVCKVKDISDYRTFFTEFAKYHNVTPLQSKPNSGQLEVIWHLKDQDEDGNWHINGELLLHGSHDFVQLQKEEKVDIHYRVVLTRDPESPSPERMAFNIQQKISSSNPHVLHLGGGNYSDGGIRTIEQEEFITKWNASKTRVYSIERDYESSFTTLSKLIYQVMADLSPDAGFFLSPHLRKEFEIKSQRLIKQLDNLYFYRNTGQIYVPDKKKAKKKADPIGPDDLLGELVSKVPSSYKLDGKIMSPKDYYDTQIEYWMDKINSLEREVLRNSDIKLKKLRCYEIHNPMVVKMQASRPQLSSELEKAHLCQIRKFQEEADYDSLTKFFEDLEKRDGYKSGPKQGSYVLLKFSPGGCSLVRGRKAGFEQGTNLDDPLARAKAGRTSQGRYSEISQAIMAAVEAGYDSALNMSDADSKKKQVALIEDIDGAIWGWNEQLQPEMICPPADKLIDKFLAVCGIRYKVFNTYEEAEAQAKKWHKTFGPLKCLTQVISYTGDSETPVGHIYWKGEPGSSSGQALKPSSKKAKTSSAPEKASKKVPPTKRPYSLWFDQGFTDPVPADTGTQAGYSALDIAEKKAEYYKKKYGRQIYIKGSEVKESKSKYTLWNTFDADSGEYSSPYIRKVGNSVQHIGFDSVEEALEAVWKLFKEEGELIYIKGLPARFLLLEDKAGEGKPKGVPAFDVPYVTDSGKPLWIKTQKAAAAEIKDIISNKWTVHVYDSQCSSDPEKCKPWLQFPKIQ